ncbi:hypothetical protein G5C51_41300 [Streptomyces sp. A7024]|uniref:EF-hand domain-containing protein n=1 Tax=Streptomyces coryli TaxID=1128680 RepID=A0A6G4UEX2_9ACTN|nr:lipase family protein [Streptomyces coryli]NGN70308.1 hypothetical protein [Streptomyces coryli]
MADRALGTLISNEPLPPGLWPAAAGRAERILYQGLGYDGRPREVTASAFVPDAAPAVGDRPVISYAHGSTGLGDGTAPSVKGFSATEAAHIDGWLRAGFAVVASDYEGLATPGPHPYFNGEAVADDLLDAVRALRHLDATVGGRYAVAGFSQGGHAALFAALIATGYAPELQFLGAIAMAPPISLTQLIAKATEADGQSVSPLVPVTLTGVSVSHPGFRPRELVTDTGVRLLGEAEELSLLDMLRRTVLLTNKDAGFTGITRQPAVAAALDASDAPVSRLDRPLLLAAGGADEVVPVEFLRDFARLLREAGTEVEFREYAEANHAGVLSGALPDAVVWARAAFVGAAEAEAAGASVSAGAAGDGDGTTWAPRRFGLLDAAGDGYVCRADMVAFALRLVQALGQAPGSAGAVAVRDGYLALWDALARASDADGDGRVSEAEYRAWLGGAQDAGAVFGEQVRPLARAVIELVDENGDGVLDRGEFLRLLAACRIPYEEGRELFGRLDTDGSGTISADEIIAAVRDFMTGADSPGYWLFGRF